MRASDAHVELQTPILEAHTRDPRHPPRASRRHRGRTPHRHGEHPPPEIPRGTPDATAPSSRRLLGLQASTSGVRRPTPDFRRHHSNPHVGPRSAPRASRCHSWPPHAPHRHVEHPPLKFHVEHPTRSLPNILGPYTPYTRTRFLASDAIVRAFATHVPVPASRPPAATTGDTNAVVAATPPTVTANIHHGSSTWNRVGGDAGDY